MRNTICTLCVRGSGFHTKSVFFFNIFVGDLYFDALIIELFSQREKINILTVRLGLSGMLCESRVKRKGVLSYLSYLCDVEEQFFCGQLTPLYTKKGVLTM